MNKQFKPLYQQVELFLTKESSGHDVYHAQRVLNNALYIQSKEGGDEYIIGCAALVHDICRPWEKKTGKSHFSPEAIEIIREVLIESNIKKGSIDPILNIVEKHDIYDWTEKQEKSIELRVVQDADNLDAIGAMGIARTFMFGGHYGSPMYLPEEKLEFSTDFVDGAAKGKSVIAHFYEKLLKLKENMNTTTGKNLGEQRHQVMVDFLDQFFSEWEGSFNS